jgi:hypothetical protein
MKERIAYPDQVKAGLTTQSKKGGYMKMVMGMNLDLDSCMTAAIILGDINPQEIDIDLAHCQALPEQLANPEIPCVECGGSGETKLNDWDHHFYNGDQGDKEYIPPACIQAAREKLGEIPPVVQAIGAWDEGKFGEFPEFKETQIIFGGMLLDVRNVMEQAKEGIILCQKWLAGDFSLSPKEKKWKEIKKNYDIKIAEEMEKVEYLQTKQNRTLAYVESEFWGTLRACQEPMDTEDVVVVKNPTTNKITIALKPASTSSLKGICDLLNKIEPGWGGPITGKIIGSPQKGSRLELREVVQIVRLFM